MAFSAVKKTELPGLLSNDYSRHRLRRARTIAEPFSLSVQGHSRPMHSLPVPINVRCCSHSDMIVRRHAK